MGDNSVETKLAAARTRLILDKPFLGALALRLPMVAANEKWCPTSATDARKFYYNPAYIAALTLDETQFVLAHEALHCALSHFARRQHRVKHRWDVACDHAINPLLVSDGLKPPPGVLLLDAFQGMTAEEIYPCIEDNNSEQTMDQHLYDSDESEGGQSGESDQEPQQGGHQGGEQQSHQGSGQSGSKDKPAGQREQPGQEEGASPPRPLSASERDELGQQWQQRMAAAAQQAMAAGKMSGVMARLVENLLQPQLPWRALLARYLAQVARDDYSYMRPSRREGDVIFPSLRSGQIDLVVALDTSGSVGESDITQFLSEVDALKGQLRARVSLLACDEDLVEGSPWEFEPWEALRLPDQIKGGGGTRFTPVFDWIARQGRRPDLLLYFTDAEGEFPPHEPHYPTLWLVKGKAPVPWGQRIQLN